MRYLPLTVLLCACSAPKPVVPPPAPSVGLSPLRRLTNSQYLNALHDVLGEGPVLDELPADPVVGGFDNFAVSQQPSELRVERFAAVSEQYAEHLTSDSARLARTLGCDRWTTRSEQDVCLTSLFAGTGRLLFRHTLSEAEQARFRARVDLWREQVDFEGAVQLLLESMLQSPQFLYRPEPASEFGSVALASRLSFLLWDTGPDGPLLDLAESGGLSTPEQVRGAAQRLLADPRARRTLWGFHRQWLALDRLLLDEHSQRTAEVDPMWTAATQSSAMQETRLFVENVLFDEGTLSALLTSRRAWVDAEAARLYRLPSPALAWNETTLDATQRSGLLTRVAFLAGTSHRGGTSPPIRGNSINLHLLCRLPTPPPPGIDTSVPVPAPGAQTNRMAFAAKTGAPACAGCHRSLNGLGFGFEHYGAGGRWQDQEVGLPIDATGEIFQMGAPLDGPFDGALALSDVLAASPQVHDCATRMWVRYSLGRAPTETESPWVDQLVTDFSAQEGDVRALLLNLVSSPLFMQLGAEP